ncbi:MAG: hypothetical protein NTY95_18410, partial [Bacteroidia bacterium]|nr:hypothetical protein [Bacteroidia bacterium]
KLKEINNQFSLYTKDPNKLIDFVVEIRRIKKIIKDRLDRGSIRNERIKDANNFIKASEDLENSIQGTISSLTEQTEKISQKQKGAPKRVLKKLVTIKTTIPETRIENLISLLESLDIPLNEEHRAIFKIIDERVIQALSENEKHYFEILKELKDEFEKLN